MKETLKTFVNRCRCCLESFQEDETCSPITEFFAIQFYAFTRLELETNDMLSNHVCEFCHSELLRFSVFKKDLIEKQLKLYGLIKEYNRTKNVDECYMNGDDEDEILEANNNEEDEYDEIDQLGSISENFTESSEEESEQSLYRGEKSFNEQDKRLICDYCQHAFINKQGLANHVRSHLPVSKENDWMCDHPQCNFSTNSHFRLKKHKKRVHEITSDEPSEDKNISRASAQSNFREFGRIVRYRCFCGMTFKRKSGLDMHRTKVHGSLNSCSYGCDKNFTSPGRWIRHIRDYHPANESECLKMIKASKNNVWYTEIRQHDPVRDDLECGQCSFYADDKADLVEHLKTTHQNANNLRECIACLKKFSSEESMTMHINKEHDGFKGRHHCPMCSARFKHIGEIREHMSVKHDSAFKPFSCTECDETFELSSYLKLHEKNVHNISKSDPKPKDIKQKILVCVCKKSFKYQAWIASHQMKCKVFKKLCESEESPEFKCETCDKKFLAKIYLTRHQKLKGHQPK